VNVLYGEPSFTQAERARHPGSDSVCQAESDQSESEEEVWYGELVRLNPNPQIFHPTPYTSNPKPYNPNLEPQSPTFEPSTPHPKPAPAKTTAVGLTVGLLGVRAWG